MPIRERPGREARSYSQRTFWLPFLFFAMLGTLWALATPPLSAPDEVAHSYKAIALVRGTAMGTYDPATGHVQLPIPEEFSFDSTMMCYWTHPEVSAACSVPLGSLQPGQQLDNWVANYNPLYYASVGWPSLIVGGDSGIYLMRVASALLSAVFFAWAAQLALARPARRWLASYPVFLAAPMLLYLSGSINPSGIEIASGAALWIALLRLLELASSPGGARGGAYLWVVAAASSVYLANARALGPLWVLLVALGAVLVVGWRPFWSLLAQRTSWLWLGLILAGGVFSFVWTRTSGTLSSQAEPGDTFLVGASPLQGAFTMLRHFPEFMQQALGYFGWLDTPLPAEEYWIPIGLTTAFLLMAVLVLPRRASLTLLAFAAATFLIPAAVQGISVSQTGFIWQGRYGIILFLGVGVVAAWLLSAPGRAERVAFLSERMTWALAAGFGIFGLLAFVFVMYRYAVGIGAEFTRFLHSPEWQPPLGWVSLAVLYLVVSALLACWIGMQARALGRRAEPPTFPESRAPAAGGRRRTETAVQEQAEAPLA